MAAVADSVDVAEEGKDMAAGPSAGFGPAGMFAAGQEEWATAASHQLLIQACLGIKANRLRFCWNCYQVKWYKPAGTCVWSACSKFGFENMLRSQFEDPKVVAFIEEITELVQANHTKDTMDFDSIQLDLPDEVGLQLQKFRQGQAPLEAKVVLMEAKSKASSSAGPSKGKEKEKAKEPEPKAKMVKTIFLWKGGKPKK